MSAIDIIENILFSQRSAHNLFSLSDPHASGVFRFYSWGDMILSSSPSFKATLLKLGLRKMLNIIYYSIWWGGITSLTPHRKYATAYTQYRKFVFSKT